LSLRTDSLVPETPELVSQADDSLDLMRQA
jgi:hypothetical protein